MQNPASMKHSVKTRVCGSLITRSFKSRFMFIVLILVLSVQHTRSQSLAKRNNEYVVVTVPQKIKSFHKNRKLKSYRPQLHSDSSGVEVRITQTSKPPQNIRKVQVRYSKPGGRSEAFSSRKDDMVSLMRAGQIKKPGPLQSDSPSYSANIQRSITLSNPALSGAALPFHQWHTLTRTRPARSNETVSFRVKQGFLKRYTFHTDTLPVVHPVGFPAIDAIACEPFDRFYARKQLKGYGLDKIKYEPYKIPNRKLIRKSFEVYFEKNKATLAGDHIEPIIQYLRENNLSILDIRIEGYSSIEGDSVLNRQLQSRRAQQLIAVLQRYNNEPIFRDTVITAEAWDAFRTSLRRTPLKWLDTLSNPAIRKLINSDQHLLEQVEQLLKPLRRGKLSITLGGKFSTEDIVERIFKDFNQTGWPLEDRKTSAKAIAVIEAKLMGMIEYADAMVQAGKIESGTLASLVDNSPFAAQARILLFYHLIRKHETQRSEMISNTWDSVFVKRDWNNMFSVAHSNALHLIADPRNTGDRTKRLRQMEDIQYYTIKYIEEGLLDPAVLCSIEYPHNPLFYGVKLNHYAIAYALSERYEFPCYGFKKDTAHIVLKPTRFDEQKLNTFMEQRQASMQPGPANTKGSFDVSEKGDYYFFIKTLFLSRDKSILQFVRTSDNFAEFDLYYLLRITIDEWDPVVNHYYDRDIQLQEMDGLIRTMRTIRKRTCTVQLNQLYLDYYFKSMMYISNHTVPGDKGQLRIAEDAFKHLSAYYAKRSNYLFPKLTIYLTDALNNFYSLPTRKASTEYAAKIMQAVNRRTMLTEGEMERWEVYRGMYYPKKK